MFRFKICCIILVLVVVTYGKNKVLTDNEYFFPNLNKKIKVEKVLDEKTGRIKFSSNSAEIRSSQDLENLKKKEEYLVKKKYGCLDRGLRKKYDKLKKKVKVRVVLKRPKVKYLDKTKHSEDDLKAQSFEILNIEPYVSTDYLIKQKKIRSVSKKDRFFIETEMSKEELGKVMFDDNVACVEEVVETKPVGDRDFRELSRSACNPYPIVFNGTQFAAGQGIGAATFETGIGAFLLQRINTSPYIPNATIDPARCDIVSKSHYHSNICFGLLYHAAPLSNLAHIKTTFFSSSMAQDAIINRRIQTASASVEHVWSETLEWADLPPNWSDYLVMDEFAYRWPYPLFCNPTRNDFDRTVDWANYNSISVGNVQHYDLTDFEHLPDFTDDGTAWINQPGVYSTSRDREMPHILAPGYHPDRGGDKWTSPYLFDSWSYGTSFSAPTASGIAACVMSADSRMTSWPEKVRVALMLTAENLHSGYWDGNSDGQDGNGVISGKTACEFAVNHTEVWEDENAVQTGLCASSWFSSDNDNKTFKIKIPNRKPNDHHLRIVLTWDSNPDLNNEINHLSDLDLVFISDNGVYQSSSWNSNVEVIDVPMNKVTAGATYSANIYPSQIRTGDMSFFYYSIGWTWVKDHIND